MSWIKTTWTAISAAILAALAIFAVASAQRHKKTARKWQDKAVAIEQGNVVNGIQKAEQATTQAKLHEAKAESIKAKAEARITQIGDKDEDVADILTRWGA